MLGRKKQLNRHCKERQRRGNLIEWIRFHPQIRYRRIHAPLLSRSAQDDSVFLLNDFSYQ